MNKMFFFMLANKDKDRPDTPRESIPIELEMWQAVLLGGVVIAFLCFMAWLIYSMASCGSSRTPPRP